MLFQGGLAEYGDPSTTPDKIAECKKMLADAKCGPSAKALLAKQNRPRRYEAQPERVERISHRAQKQPHDREDDSADHRDEAGKTGIPAWPSAMAVAMKRVACAPWISMANPAPPVQRP